MDPQQPPRKLLYSEVSKLGPKPPAPKTPVPKPVLRASGASTSGQAATFASIAASSAPKTSHLVQEHAQAPQTIPKAKKSPLVIQPAVPDFQYKSPAKDVDPAQQEAVTQVSQGTQQQVSQMPLSQVVQATQPLDSAEAGPSTSQRPIPRGPAAWRAQYERNQEEKLRKGIYAPPRTPGKENRPVPQSSGSGTNHAPGIPNIHAHFQWKSTGPTAEESRELLIEPSFPGPILPTFTFFGNQEPSNPGVLDPVIPSEIPSDLQDYLPTLSRTAGPLALPLDRSDLPFKIDRLQIGPDGRPVWPQSTLAGQAPAGGWTTSPPQGDPSSSTSSFEAPKLSFEPGVTRFGQILSSAVGRRGREQSSLQYKSAGQAYLPNAQQGVSSTSQNQSPLAGSSFIPYDQDARTASQGTLALSGAQYGGGVPEFIMPTISLPTPYVYKSEVPNPQPTQQPQQRSLAPELAIPTVSIPTPYTYQPTPNQAGGSQDYQDISDPQQAPLSFEDYGMEDPSLSPKMVFHHFPPGLPIPTNVSISQMYGDPMQKVENTPPFRPASKDPATAAVIPATPRGQNSQLPPYPISKKSPANKSLQRH